MSPVPVVAHNGRVNVSEDHRDHDEFLNELELWEHECLFHSPQLRNLPDPHTGDIDHLVDELQLGNHFGLQKQPLRHDLDVDDLSLHTTGV